MHTISWLYDWPGPEGQVSEIWSFVEYILPLIETWKVLVIHQSNEHIDSCTMYRHARAKQDKKYCQLIVISERLQRSCLCWVNSALFDRLIWVDPILSSITRHSFHESWHVAKTFNLHCHKECKEVKCWPRLEMKLSLVCRLYWGCVVSWLHNPSWPESRMSGSPDNTDKDQLTLTLTHRQEATDTHARNN